MNNIDTIRQIESDKEELLPERAVLEHVSDEHHTNFLSNSIKSMTAMEQTTLTHTM